MREGLRIKSLPNLENGEWPRFRMGNLPGWYMKYSEFKSRPCSAGWPATGEEDGPAWTPISAPAETDRRDAGMDI